MKHFRHFGHPKERVVGPLQKGWHAWFDGDKQITGIVIVDEGGESLIASVPRTLEEAQARREMIVQAEAARKESERRHAEWTRRTIAREWNRPTGGF